MLGEMAITSLPKLPKLIESLQRKKGYVLHYLTLQLYVQSGVKVTHFHRVLQFRQAKWISPFVELNTELRKAAKNRFQEKFYKVIVNSAFGRTMESKRNRRKLSIIRNENETMQKLCNSSLKCFQITDEDLAFRPTSIRWDKPTIVGAVILGQSIYVQLSPYSNETEIEPRTAILRQEQLHICSKNKRRLRRLEENE